VSKLRDKLSRLSHPLSARAPEGALRHASSQAAHSPRAEAESAVLEERAPEPEGVLADASAATPSLPWDGKAERLAALRTQMVSLERKLVRESALVVEREVERTLEVPAERAACGGLPGVVEETEHGPLRRVITQHEEDHHHGSIPVSLALEACARDLAVLALDPTLESIDFSRALYIDTETTGLLGGSGTLPFLIGLAWFEGRCLRVEQMLLERPGLEVPMLQRLAQVLAQASCIVSYNGKSFDWPLLRTRFIMNRVAAPKVPAHLDLLHCARRVYKRRLGAVRLINLDESILGFERVDDMPGELIPQTYLGFLRGQVAGGALLPVVDHNRHDLVALAAILGELVRRFRGEDAQDARDQFGFASVAARAEDHSRALAFAEAAAEADIRGELAPEALYLAGELKLRAGEFHAALQAFLQSLEAAGFHEQHASRAHLALAKLCEHKLRDFQRALHHAQHTGPCEGEDGRARRVARLQRKVEPPGLPLG
jgi:uncharacterized protein YprB with RNaseH-like and TPR domain